MSMYMCAYFSHLNLGISRTSLVIAIEAIIPPFYEYLVQFVIE